MIDVSRPIHIEEILGGWKVRREEADALRTYLRRDDAVAFAAGMARAAGGGTIVIRRHDGSVDTLSIAEGVLEDLDELGKGER